MEARLRAAWCQVLDMEDDELDGDSHFFREGGDSVAAIRLIGIAEEYRIQLDNAIIYGFPILKNMASNSQEILVSDTTAPDAVMQNLDEDLVRECANVCRVEQHAIEDIFPATEIQTMMFDWHKRDASALLQYVFQIHGPARKDRIREVIDVMRQKNQILRTRIVQHNDVLYQVVVRDMVEWYEGTNLSAYRSQVFSHDGWVGYGDPLYRYAFIDEGRDLYFAYTAHHSGYDGRSHHVMFDAFEKGLHNLEALREKPVQTQFKRFSEWLENRSKTEDKVAKSMAFWKSYLDGFQGLTNRLGVALDHKPYGATGLTQILPLKRRASAFALSTMAHAALAISFGNIYQQDDILFMSATSGRRFPRDDPLPKAESIMGPLLGAIYFRTRLHADQAIEDFLQDTQDNILSTIPYQHESRKAAAEILGTQITYASFFNWHPIGDDTATRVIDFESHDGSTTRLEGRRDLYTPMAAPVRLSVHVWEHHDHLKIHVKWNPKLYDDTFPALILDELTDTLSKITRSKADSVRDLWRMRHLSDNQPADGHQIDQSETFLAAQEALVHIPPPWTDSKDTFGTKGQERWIELTAASSAKLPMVQTVSLGA